MCSFLLQSSMVGVGLPLMSNGVIDLNEEGSKAGSGVISALLGVVEMGHPSALDKALPCTSCAQGNSQGTQSPSEGDCVGPRLSKKLEHYKDSSLYHAPGPDVSARNLSQDPCSRDTR